MIKYKRKKSCPYCIPQKKAPPGRRVFTDEQITQAFQHLNNLLFTQWLIFVCLCFFAIISRAIVFALLKTESNRGKASSKLSLSMLIDQPSSESSIGKIKGGTHIT
jgi:hypothetical protein